MFDGSPSSPKPRQRVLIVAAVVFVAAGALGSGVADQLDPYGADDPATESVRADHRLEDAGYRETGVVVLVDDVDVDHRAGTRPGRGDRRRDRRRPRCRRGQRLSRHPLAGLRLRDGDATYLAVGSDADRRRAAPGRRRAHRRPARGRARRHGRRAARRPAAGQRAGRERPAHAPSSRLPAALPALAALLPQPRRRAAAAAGRRAGDRQHVPHAAGRQRARLDSRSSRSTSSPGSGLGLAIDYSLFIVSRYREEIAKTGPGHRGDAPDAGDRRAHRAVLLADGRRRARRAARLPAALPLLDGPRRAARRAGRRRDRADRPARGARPARQRVNALAPSVPAAARRARRAPGDRRVLVPPLAARHAASRPDRDRQRDAPDRARHPVLQRSSSPGSTPRCCPTSQRPPGRRRAASRLPAVPRHADHARGRRRPAAGAARGRARRGELDGSPRSSRPVELADGAASR